MITTVNCETGEVTTRELNADELAQQAMDQERTANEETELAAKTATKQAVLDKLGLTADEVIALLN